MKTICSAIVIKDNRVLLIKRSIKLENHPNYWAIPGGQHDEGEELIDAATRELREETGLTFLNPTLFFEEQTLTHHFFRYLGDAVGRVILQESECDGYGWFAYSELSMLKLADNMRQLLDLLHARGHI